MAQFPEDFEDVKEPYQDDDLLAASSLEDVTTPGGTMKNFLERDNFEEELGDLSRLDLTQDLSHIAQYNIVDVIGDDKAGRRIVVVYAHRLPDRTSFDHFEFLRYLQVTLDRFVDLDYTIVYFHYGLSSKNKPPWKFLLQAYRLLDRKYKKNLKDLYLIHPTKFIKVIWNFFRPFISVKFERKLHYLNYISELKQVLHDEQITIPPEIEDYDRKLRTAAKSTFLASPQAIAEIPLDTQQFGVSLAFIQENNKSTEPIPPVLVECVAYLRTGDNLHTEGLFRRSVGVSELKNTQARLNRGEKVNFEDEPNAIHLSAVLIKSFLRELSEPVTTFDRYDSVAVLQDIKDDEKRREHVKSIIDALPEMNRMVLKFVVGFLTEVMARSDTNKMNASNLSIVFGPNLAWPRGSPASLSSMQNLNNFAYILITQYEYIF